MKVRLLSCHYIYFVSSRQAKAEGRAPTPADLGPLATNTEFLKGLERGVARWIREIQKVTNLDRDPSSGTARQEIRFVCSVGCGIFKEG